MPVKRAAIRINLGYPLAQLQKAFASTGSSAGLRVRQWQQVIGGLLEGTLQIGSRTPVADIPAWVSLEVVHGGFATGQLAAGGPLQEHEIKKIHALGRSAESGRADLNAYFLDKTGQREIEDMLDNGRYRVHVPEEGALLIVAWLMSHAEQARARKLVEVISPFLGKLRFYPVPHSRPIRISDGVYLQTVGQSTRSLEAKRAQDAVERMKEAVNVWTPLYDRAVQLFLETVEGPVPSFRTAASGGLVRQTNGQPIVEGGWPCRRQPDGWRDKAGLLLADYGNARQGHRLCGKPEKRKENFARLRFYLGKYLDEPRSLSGRDVGMIRKILASYVWRHGAPGEPRLQETRSAQVRNAAIPSHHRLAAVLVQRLRRYPDDEGCQDMAALVAPLTAEESRELGANAVRLPAYLTAKAMRCLEAPVSELVRHRLLGSSESMATVIPQLTARVRGAAVKDLGLRRAYESIYMAFRRRRSLLLLDLQSQVKLSELPWIAAVEPWVGSDEASREAARETLVLVAGLAIHEFPQTIIPNKLTQEFRALATGAGLSIPLVDELAADIFMGAFSEKFLRAAQSAARLLQGTLYERYYGLPYDRLLALDDIERSSRRASVSPGFARICEELAGAHTGDKWSVARNGTIIEQGQILTTQNLAVLIGELSLQESLRNQLADLAQRCFQWVCERHQMTIRDWHAQMQMVKNTAYAWRQMLVYLSLLSQPEILQFLDWSADHLRSRRPDFRQRFEPVMVGLREVMEGGSFDAGGRHQASGGRRFLGWSTQRHWLLPPNRQ